jgi:CheY-like chemotaxis protein
MQPKTNGAVNGPHPHTAILAVEDSDDDFEAMIRAFNRAGMQNTIVRRDNGQTAIAYLEEALSDTPPHPLPCMVMLDLNLPGIDGRKVLKHIKQHPQLCWLPVVVLTTSDDERDVDECYRFGANSYILKPVDFEGFIRSIQRLRQYWFEIVVMPRPDMDKEMKPSTAA